MKVSLLINQLQKISRTFDAHSAHQKIKLMDEICSSKNVSSKQISTLHDLILFIKAYPENQKVSARATQSLIWISEKIASSETLKFELQNSGFTNTQLITSYSFQTIKWLLNNYPNQCSLYSADATQAIEQLKRLLPQALSDQFELYHLSIKKWLHKINPDKKNELKTLINLVDNYTDDVWAKESLYSAFEAYVQINLTPDVPSLTTAAISFINPFYSTLGLKKNIDLKKLFKIKPTEKIHLGLELQLELEKLARLTFCCYHRETDPVTYCKADEIKCFDAGRGFSVVLYHLQPEFRLPFESYVGYVAYKNGLPMAYGGAWIYRHRAKIGINIFPPYRGGESSFLFAGLLRVYHHFYGVKQFAVQPYQIGLNNDDGIKSGAFWFYYRFGFVPVQQKLAAIAEQEFNRMKNSKSYKVPVSILKELAHSQMEWKSDNTVKSLYDTSLLSTAFINHVNKNFDGNFSEARQKTITYFKKSLTISNNDNEILQSLYLMAPLLSLISNFDEWKSQEQNQLLTLLRIRTLETEQVFQYKLAGHKKLCNLFDSIVSSATTSNPL